MAECWPIDAISSNSVWSCGSMRPVLYRDINSSRLVDALKHLQILIMIDPRMTLVQLGFFGSPENHELKFLLNEAFCDFKTWCKLQKIATSQGRFTPNLVAWFLWNMLHHFDLFFYADFLKFVFWHGKYLHWCIAPVQLWAGGEAQSWGLHDSKGVQRPSHLRMATGLCQSCAQSDFSSRGWSASFRAVGERKAATTHRWTFRTATVCTETRFKMFVVSKIVRPLSL